MVIHSLESLRLFGLPSFLNYSSLSLPCPENVTIVLASMDWLIFQDMVAEKANALTPTVPTPSKPKRSQDS